MMPTAALMRSRTDCRLCSSKEVAVALELKATPPANDFIPEDKLAEAQPFFPLKVWLCQDCGHLQLLDIVSPELLFRNYVYVSSTSPVFVEHFRSYAADILELTKTSKSSRVIEIGSNDGIMLRFFKEAGLEVLGIDPAEKIAAQATAAGLETLPEFFTAQLADQLKAQGRGNARIIAANNVFAHADDLAGIADGIATLLADDGVFVFEVSYLVDVFQKTLFDTIYHEHLSYHGVKPLVRFFESHGMELIDAQRVGSHGGSLRGIAQKKGGPYAVSDRVGQCIEYETSLGLYELETFQRFAAQINDRKQELRALLQRLKAEGKKVVGFGAPAKATTLMYHFELDRNALDYIIDDSPLKQGLYSPGFHIPVVPSEYLYQTDTRPDYAVILAWNFAEPIRAKHKQFTDRGGHFIVPLPNVEVF